MIDTEWIDAADAPMKEGFRKEFEVGPPDREPIAVKDWKIQPPAAGTREALSIAFPESMDHALAKRMIQVARGDEFVSGAATLQEEERRWAFVPATVWRPGAYAIYVQKTIEDLAGNNIGKAFEVDVLEKIERRFTNETVRLSFEIR